jgi:hypothetical protein
MNSVEVMKFTPTSVEAKNVDLVSSDAKMSITSLLCTDVLAGSGTLEFNELNNSNSDMAWGTSDMKIDSVHTDTHFEAKTLTVDQDMTCDAHHAFGSFQADVFVSTLAQVADREAVSAFPTTTDTLTVNLYNTSISTSKYWSYSAGTGEFTYSGTYIPSGVQPQFLVSVRDSWLQADPPQVDIIFEGMIQYYDPVLADWTTLSSYKMNVVATIEWVHVYSANVTLDTSGGSPIIRAMRRSSQDCEWAGGLNGPSSISIERLL